jgi:hypothetical protein
MSEVPEPAASPCQCGPCVAKTQDKRLRAWRWLAGVDLTKPPAPLLRWLGVFVVGIVYAVAGAPTKLEGWLWAAILGGILIFPDVAGFGVAGVRLDLKQAQDEIATLRADVNAQARATARASVGPIYIGGETKPGLEAYGEVAGAERDQQQPYVRRHLDTGTSMEVPS